MPTVAAGEAGAPNPSPSPRSPGGSPLREVTEQALLRHLAPVGALVDAQGALLYLHGRTGRYLEPAPGEAAVPNILKMARRGLRRELTTALHKAQTTRETVTTPGLRVKTNGDYSLVNLSVRPVVAVPGSASEALLYLVVLEERPAEAPAPEVPVASEAPAPEGAEAPDRDARMTALRQELKAKEEYLQTTVEELETSNEQLRSSNEEMQSMNEELQSTNEELETSKEELQSVNEELATVNAELQTKVVDLSRVNNDMNNLLAGTGIATVFVDHQLHIVRFTPAATRLINLIATDVGRPVGHIISNLVGYDHLVDDAQEVLDTLIPREVEVQSRDGRWFSMRMQPYRTLENVIEGAVISFIDVTEVKETREALARSETLLETTETLIHLGGFEWNVARKTMFWTEEAYRLHDLDPAKPLTDAERLEQSLSGFGAAERPGVEAAFGRCAETGEPFDLTHPFTTTTGRRLTLRMAAEPVCGRGRRWRGWSASSSTPPTRRSRTGADPGRSPREAHHDPPHPAPRGRRRPAPARRDAGGGGAREGTRAPRGADPRGDPGGVPQARGPPESSWRCRTRSCAGPRRPWTRPGRATSISTTWRRWATAPSTRAAGSARRTSWPPASWGSTG